MAWKPSESSLARTDAPYFLLSRTVNLTATANLGTITHLAESGSLSILRTVQLARASSTVWVTYTFSVSGAIDQVSIPVIGTSLSRLNNFDQVTQTLAIGHDPSFRQAIGARVRIMEGGDDLTEVRYNTNPEASMPEVRFTFTPRASIFRASFEAEIIFSPDAQATDVRIANAMSIFETARVDFVFVDKLKVRETEWFTNDPAHFRIAYQNFAVAVYEVI